MSNPFTNNGSINNRDPIHYPTLIQKSNPNNPFIMFNESQLPNYTNPQKQIMHSNTPFIINNDIEPGSTTIKNKNPFNDNGKASSISTSFNIMKGIMGIGLLILPWSIATIGLLPSFILIAISFILSYSSWIFLCLLSDKYKVYTYRDIGLILFGKDFAYALDLIILTFCYLVCILYLILLSEFIADGLAQFNIIIDQSLTFGNLMTIKTFKQFIRTKFFIVTIAIFCILFPLSLLPRLDSLKYSSFLGMIACFYIIGLMVFTFFDEKDKNGYYFAQSVTLINYHNDSIIGTEEHKFFWFWLSSFSIFVACFNTHFNGPALYGELKNKSTKKFINVSSVSFFLVLFLNLVIGLCGYFAFGNNCDKNILNVLEHGIVVSVAQLIMTLTIIGTYPLLFWNIKVSIDNLILYKNITNENHTKIKKIERKYTCLCSKLFVYFIVTLTIWIIAIVATDVALILSFLQSLLGNLIVFIFPSIFYLQMIKNEQFNTQYKYNTKLFLVTSLCYIVVTFGAICVIGGCTASVMFWVGYIQ